MSVSLWKNYDSKSAYDGYLTEENKIRKHARIMTGILERHGTKKQYIQRKQKQCTACNQVSQESGFQSNSPSEPALASLDKAHITRLAQDRTMHYSIVDSSHDCTLGDHSSFAVNVL